MRSLWLVVILLASCGPGNAHSRTLSDSLDASQQRPVDWNQSWSATTGEHGGLILHNADRTLAVYLNDPDLVPRSGRIGDEWRGYVSFGFFPPCRDDQDCDGGTVASWPLVSGVVEVERVDHVFDTEGIATDRGEIELVLSDAVADADGELVPVPELTFVYQRRIEPIDPGTRDRTGLP